MIQALYQALQISHPWERISEIQSIKEPLQIASTVRWRHEKLQNSLPRQDSNLESSAPEADALSIRPRETLEDEYGEYGH